MAKLVWSDEFDNTMGAPPDPRWWRAETGGHGWGNAELQTYTDMQENAFHDGEGNLVIRANRTGVHVSSARLVTKGRFTFQYGRLECRARVAPGQGLWSAIWALGANIDDVPWPGCGEIDIVECLGADPHRLFGTVHCPGHSGVNGLSGEFRSTSPLPSSFRTYAVDWSPARIGWCIDGAEYFSVTRGSLGRSWVFDHPFYLLINLAVGGVLGGRVDTEALPSELIVDYVRVFGP